MNVKANSLLQLDIVQGRYKSNIVEVGSLLALLICVGIVELSYEPNPLKFLKTNYAWNTEVS